MDIEITAYDQESEPWRLARLNMIVGYLVAKLGWRSFENIKGLRDHKGNLTVTWIHNPTKQDRNIVETAWESGIANELADNVEHIIINDRVSQRKRINSKMWEYARNNVIPINRVWSTVYAEFKRRTGTYPRCGLDDIEQLNGLDEFECIIDELLLEIPEGLDCGS